MNYLKIDIQDRISPSYRLTIPFISHRFAGIYGIMSMGRADNRYDNVIPFLGPSIY